MHMRIINMHHMYIVCLLDVNLFHVVPSHLSDVKNKMTTCDETDLVLSHFNIDYFEIKLTVYINLIILFLLRTKLFYIFFIN